APTVLGFWHWAVVNIPGDVTQLPTGAGDESGAGLPPGAFHLPNDARTKRYVGSAPPEGTGKHRYIFAALALDAEKIEIDSGATTMEPRVRWHLDARLRAVRADGLRGASAFWSGRSVSPTFVERRPSVSRRIHT